MGGREGGREGGRAEGWGVGEWRGGASSAEHHGDDGRTSWFGPVSIAKDGCMCKRAGERKRMRACMRR